MNTKLKILMPGWSTGDNSFGAGKAYMEYFSQYGDVILCPPTKTIFDWVDMVVLPGGMDTLSSRYNENPSYFNSNPDLFKEWFLDKSLPKYIDKNIPIFGVCLGHQMLNVHFGGNLTQNCEHPYSEKTRDQQVHELFIANKALKKELYPHLKPNELPGINSLHHQGIDATDDLALDCLDVVAMGPMNMVEAMIHKTLPIASVQWHPEEIYDPLSQYLIETILERKQKPKESSTTKIHDLHEN